MWAGGSLSISLSLSLSVSLSLSLPHLKHPSQTVREHRLTTELEELLRLRSAHALARAAGEQNDCNLPVRGLFQKRRWEGVEVRGGVSSWAGWA